VLNLAKHHENIWGAGGMIPWIINPDTRCRCHEEEENNSCTGNKPKYSLDRRLGGPQNWS